MHSIEEIRAALPKIEQRFTPVAPIQSKVPVPSGNGKIVGYGAVFGSLSEDLGGFREIIRPGAFRRTLRERPDIVCCLNHDPSLILGRTSAGTARITEDSVGLLVEIDPPETQVADDATELVRSKHITSMSFSFGTREDNWQEAAGEVVRELIDVDLYEVGPVTFPAYPATVVGSGSGGRAAEPAVERPTPRATVATKTSRPVFDEYRRRWNRLDSIKLGRPEPGSLESLLQLKEILEEVAVGAWDKGDGEIAKECLKRVHAIESEIRFIEAPTGREQTGWPPRY